MFWKALFIVSILAPIVALVVWFSHGMHVYSKDRAPVVTRTKDPLFGTITTTTEWVDSYNLGLLPGSPEPHEIFDSVAFVVGASLVVGVVSIRMLKKSNNK